jgi:hypothetical protein
MFNCQQATQLFSEAQERRLTIRERAALKIHRMMCSPCTNFGKQILTLTSITKRYGRDEKIDIYLGELNDANDHKPKK